MGLSSSRHIAGWAGTLVMGLAIAVVFLADHYCWPALIVIAALPLLRFVSPRWKWKRLPQPWGGVLFYWVLLYLSAAFAVFRLLGRFPWFSLIALLVVVAAGLVLYLVNSRRLAIQLKERGFRVIAGGGSRKTYQELREGKIESLPVPEEILEYGSYILIIPSAAEWKAVAPQWAAGRRDAIFQRILSNSYYAEIRYPEDWPKEAEAS